MPAADREATRSAASRVGFVDTRPSPPTRPYSPTQPGPPPVPREISEALSSRRVLKLSYTDRAGAVTERLVEPLGFLGAEQWYLVGWCRLRTGVRGFRLDRISEVVALPEQVPARSVDLPGILAAEWPVTGLEVP
jgi:predicted DNA-binding transcriptional regulator YafY